MTEIEGWKVVHKLGDWELTILVPDDYGLVTDFELKSPDSQRYLGTIGTPEMVREIIDKPDHSEPFWMSDLILVDQLSEDSLVGAVAALIDQGMVGEALDLAPPDLENLTPGTDGDDEVRVTSGDDQVLDYTSFRRLGDALSGLPWTPFRIDFDLVGASRHPWPTHASTQAFFEATWIASFEHVVLLLTLARPDQPEGRIVESRDLYQVIDDWEVSDAIVLPFIDGDDRVLLAPAMWIEVGSNVWIWGDEPSGRQR